MKHWKADLCSNLSCATNANPVLNKKILPLHAMLHSGQSGGLPGDSHTKLHFLTCH